MSLLVGFMILLEAVVIPLYHILYRLDLTNTYWALILPQIGLSVSFGTLWMSNFFRTAPQELIDAAAPGRQQPLADAVASRPLARPAVLTLVALIYVDLNEFPLALVLVQDETLRTLPVGLASRDAIRPISLAGGRLDHRSRADLDRVHLIPAVFYPWDGHGRSKRVISDR